MWDCLRLLKDYKHSRAVRKTLQGKVRQKRSSSCGFQKGLACEQNPQKQPQTWAMLIIGDFTMIENKFSGISSAITAADLDRLESILGKKLPLPFRNHYLK